MSDLLVLAHGEQSWLLFDGEHSIGRSVANSVSVDEKGVSRRHCKVNVRNGVVEIEDLGSRFGTFVNGNLIRKQQLNVGDKIRLGDAFLEIVSADGTSEPQVPPSPPTNADPYQDPAVTQEQSIADDDVIFCKSCGLPNLIEDPACFACGKPLHSV
ncbi:MAG: FHA domain-containing protein [Planctomycetota bacterium]|nr:FHA domain-containing protein [Planctomycetota bacterium]